MKIKTKVWLEKEGRLVFGCGKALILQSIGETGSINKTAKDLDMSYRHAWSCINEIEKRLGVNLIEKTKGGKGGGGAQLTDYARSLIEKYNLLKKEVEEFADKKEKEIFV
ncbi:MAG: LysR family transcriptional regulator [Candidatus Omnitrophota bacterium]